jgi:hypothetical protein
MNKKEKREKRKKKKYYHEKEMDFGVGYGSVSDLLDCL